MAVRVCRVHRSDKNIYAQIIDDATGRTLAAASTLDKDVKAKVKNGATSEAAATVGKLIAERGIAAKVSEVVFDRGAYLYHGRVKALADAAREGGLSSDRDKGKYNERRSRARKRVCRSPGPHQPRGQGGEGWPRFGFAALVVVGDQKGRVGFGHGKAREVPEAIRKATEQAKRQMIRVPLREARTLHHDVIGHHGAGKVILRAAVPGTGIIAGGPMRAVFETLGINDIVAKSQGTAEPVQHGPGHLRCAEARRQPAFGRCPPRPQGLRPAGSPWRDRRSLTRAWE